MKGYKSTAMIEFLRNRMKTHFDFVSKPMKFAYLWGQYAKVYKYQYYFRDVL